jgi:hypothetical protein
MGIALRFSFCLATAIAVMAKEPLSHTQVSAPTVIFGPLACGGHPAKADKRSYCADAGSRSSGCADVGLPGGGAPGLRCRMGARAQPNAVAAGRRRSGLPILHYSIVEFTTSTVELEAADFSIFTVTVSTSIEDKRRADLGAAAQSLCDCRPS